ncbi:MAG: 4-hydroxy-tetrahydrodipicolinate synthase [Chlamydiia bacterium]|nr:4-hydroxy-tetrahydrodipicolinate synthase [Chlamydiia bacterium]
MSLKISGLYTALVTPFTESGLDLDGLRRNIRFQLASGVDGLLVLGTTGEAPCCTMAEKKAVIQTAIHEIGGDVPLMVGTGLYCTQSSIEATRMAHDLGADAALVVTPYYNRPTQQGIYRHFEAISDHCPIPLCIYNHPGRTGASISIDTMLRIASLDTVAAVKEASGDMNYFQQLRFRLPSDVTLLTGNDDLLLPSAAVGGDGAISVLSNVLPREAAALLAAVVEGELKNAQELNLLLFPVIQALSIESNPIPLKALMDLLGMPAGPCRLPLCAPSPEHMQQLKKLASTLQVSC